MVFFNTSGKDKDFIELIEILLLDDRQDYTGNLENSISKKSQLITDLVHTVHYVKSFKSNYATETLFFILDLLNGSSGYHNAVELDEFLNGFIRALNDYLQAKYPDTYITDLYLLLLSVLYFNLFILSNWTGPQIGFISLSDRVLLKDNARKIDNGLDELLIFGMPDKPLRDLQQDSLDFSISDRLSVDGEIIYDGVFGLPYFYLAKYLLIRLGDRLNGHSLSTLWAWKARIAYVHQSIIRNGYQNFCNSLARVAVYEFSESLKQQGLLSDFKMNYFGGNADPVPKIAIDNELKSLMLVELAKYLYMFGFYHFIQEVIDEAMRLLNISVDFTGKMGIRRKYQKIPYPQLVVNLTGANTKERSNKTITNNNYNGPNVLLLNEIDTENDILESPSLIENEESTALTVGEQAVLLSMCLLLSVNITSDDEMGLEQLNTLASKLTNENSNAYSWSVLTSALWYKTKSEHTKSSRVCRAAMQLDELSNQFYNTFVPSGDRLKHFFTIYYPSIWEIRREAAKRLVGIGSLISACELYNKLGMYEDSIICLTAMGRIDEAKKLVKQLFETHDYPYLWCSLGDIEKSEEHYIKAWELSNRRYARAQRSLGSLYYSKKNYSEATKAFEISLSINPLNKSVLYILGCCYLHLEQFDKSIETFSKTILLDPSMGDVWANMASSHFALKNYKQAKLALEEAIKYNRSNSKIWEMYLSSSLLIDDLCSVCKAVTNLYDLGLYDSVRPWSIAFILSKYDPKEGGFYAETIKNTFKVIKSGCRNADIWELLSQFCILNNDFNEAIECILKQHRRLLDELKCSDDQAKLSLRALDCYKRIISLSDKIDNRDDVLMNIKDNLNSFIKYLNDSEITSKDIEDKISEILSSAT